MQKKHSDYFCITLTKLSPIQLLAHTYTHIKFINKKSILLFKYSKKSFSNIPTNLQACPCLGLSVSHMSQYKIIKNIFMWNYWYIQFIYSLWYLGIYGTWRHWTKLHGLKTKNVEKNCDLRVWFVLPVNNSISNPIILSGCNSIVYEQTKWNMTTPLISSITQTKCLVNSQSIRQYNNKKLSRMTIPNAKTAICCTNFPIKYK